MKKSGAILPGLLLLVAFSAGAQQRYELTVKDAVDLAFKNLADVKNAELDYRIQEAKNKEILGQALPQLSGTIGANYYMSLPVFLFPDATSTAVYAILKDEGVSGANGPITKVPEPVLRQVSFQQPSNAQFSAQLTQLLFQPDVFVGLQARKTALQYSSSLLDQTKERVKDSAYRRYYAILVAQKQLYFLNEGVARLEKLYRDDSIMFENGFAERLDLERVQVQLNNLRTNRNIVESSVQIAYAALKFSLGLSQRDTVLLKEDLSEEKIKDGLLDVAFKYEDRPEIRTLGFTRELQELDLKRNRLGYYPTVAASGNFTRSGQGQNILNSNKSFWINNSFVGVSVNVPIFDGFQRRYRIQQSRLTLEKLDNTIHNVKQVIDLDQEISRESLKSALQNLDVQQRNMQLAEKVYNAIKLKFEQGLGSSFEVLQADQDWQTAQANYFNALYQATVARIGYLRSLGRLE